MKHQIPTSKLQRIFNIQIPKNPKRLCGAFEYWSLKFLWMLELDIWSFTSVVAPIAVTLSADGAGRDILCDVP